VSGIASAVQGNLPQGTLGLCNRADKKAIRETVKKHYFTIKLRVRCDHAGNRRFNDVIPDRFETAHSRSRVQLEEQDSRLNRRGRGALGRLPESPIKSASAISPSKTPSNPKNCDPRTVRCASVRLVQLELFGQIYRARERKTARYATARLPRESGPSPAPRRSIT